MDEQKGLSLFEYAIMAAIIIVIAGVAFSISPEVWNFLKDAIHLFSKQYPPEFFAGG